MLNNKPLSGLRVVDLSRILAGPWASQMLADLGAQVIKIERPDVGDDTRRWGPPYIDQEETIAAYYASANRGKQSITVDITSPQGQQIISDLVSNSDVLIENYKVGGLAKYDLDYASLNKLNSKLVYCSITGFGQTGPYKEKAGYDFMIQAMGGLMSVTGEPDSQSGSPQKVGVALVDIMTGLYATIGIQAALAEREKSGLGQHIDLALLDVQVATLANQAMNYLASGNAPQRLGNAHPNIVPYQAFATLDGHIVLAIGNDQQFSRFCSLVERDGLAQDKRFSTNPARVLHREQLVPMVSQIMLQKTTQQWLELLEPQSIPCGPINDIEQVFADPQVQARKMQQKIETSSGESISSVNNPLNFSRTPVNLDTPPPTLGEHTDCVLSEVLNYDQEKIIQLKNNKII